MALALVVFLAFIGTSPALGKNIKHTITWKLTVAENEHSKFSDGGSAPINKNTKNVYKVASDKNFSVPDLEKLDWKCSLGESLDLYSYYTRTLSCQLRDNHVEIVVGCQNDGKDDYANSILLYSKNRALSKGLTVWCKSE